MTAVGKSPETISATSTDFAQIKLGSTEEVITIAVTTTSFFWATSNM